MKRYRVYLLLAAWIFIAQNLRAQHHYNAWFRTTLSYPVHEKLKTDAEFQHRRQNGQGSNDLFENNLMFTFRSWVHYQQTEDVKFSISPFAYFSHYKIIQNDSDLLATPNSEIRFTASAELQHELAKKLFIIDRNALEYRILENNSNDITRLRNKLGFRYDFSEKLKLTIYDELLLNINGAPVHHFFDHDRLCLNIEYKVLPHLKMDLGYLHITRLPISSNHKLHENNLMLNITCQIR